MATFLSFSGSTRRASYNQQTALALANILNGAGHSAETLNLLDYEMPIYQGDLEEQQGLPDATSRLKAKLDAVDGLVIVCPEYNGFMPPVLINAIDWCTRSTEASVSLGCFVEKPIFIAAASPGPGGGGRAAVHLKTMLSGLGAHVSPLPLTVPSAFNAFNEDGAFSDEAMLGRAQKMLTKFAEFTEKLV